MRYICQTNEDKIWGRVEDHKRNKKTNHNNIFLTLFLPKQNLARRIDRSEDSYNNKSKSCPKNALAKQVWLIMWILENCHKFPPLNFSPDMEVVTAP